MPSSATPRATSTPARRDGAGRSTGTVSGAPCWTAGQTGRMDSPHAHDAETDIACAMAHGEVEAPTGERRLVAVFASPVATQLVHLAAHVGFACVVLDPTHDLDGVLTVRSAAEAGIDAHTDVVVTDHDRPELGEVLAAVLETPARWVGVMGSPVFGSIGSPVLGSRAGTGRPVLGSIGRPVLGSTLGA